MLSVILLVKGATDLPMCCHILTARVGRYALWRKQKTSFSKMYLPGEAMVGWTSTHPEFFCYSPLSSASIAHIIGVVMGRPWHKCSDNPKTGMLSSTPQFDLEEGDLEDFMLATLRALFQYKECTWIDNENRLLPVTNSDYKDYIDGLAKDYGNASVLYGH